MQKKFSMEPIHGRIEDDFIGSDNIFKLQKAKKVVIWGTKLAAQYSLFVCHKLGIQPAYITDSFPHASGEQWNGIPVIGKEALFAMESDYLVIVACHERYGIQEMLERKNISCIHFNSDALHLVRYMESEEDIRREMDRNETFISSFFDQLEDGKSKQIYFHAVNYRRNFRKEHLLALNNLSDTNQYFHNDIVSAIHGGIVVDCGAYTGDTLKEFFESSDCSCDQYIALEPTSAFYAEMKRYVKEHQLQDKTQLFQVAVWDKKELLIFKDGDDVSNKVTKNGNIFVQANTLDNLLESYDGKVDFVKMDIEGSEIPALCGARRIISKDHPVLAICIYHRIPDLWEPARIIQECYEGYRFYIRHYSDNAAETVLYAIPK